MPIWQLLSQGSGAAGQAIGAMGQQSPVTTPMQSQQSPQMGGSTTSDIIRLLSNQGAISGQGAIAQGQAAAQEAQDRANKWKTVLGIAAMAAAFI